MQLENIDLDIKIPLFWLLSLRKASVFPVPMEEWRRAFTWLLNWSKLGDFKTYILCLGQYHIILFWRKRKGTATAHFLLPCQVDILQLLVAQSIKMKNNSPIKRKKSIPIKKRFFQSYFPLRINQVKSVSEISQSKLLNLFLRVNQRWGYSSFSYFYFPSDNSLAAFTWIICATSSKRRVLSLPGLLSDKLSI